MKILYIQNSGKTPASIRSVSLAGGLCPERIAEPDAEMKNTSFV